jgi:hypothetical protein
VAALITTILASNRRFWDGIVRKIKIRQEETASMESGGIGEGEISKNG